jgi:hypothetical protein
LCGVPIFKTSMDLRRLALGLELDLIPTFNPLVSLI